MSNAVELVFGPTYEEMKHPETMPENLREAARIARSENPLDPINLFNIHWKDDLGQVMFLVVPPEITNVSTPIAVLTGNNFPTGAHKVGPAYAIIIEKQVHAEISPAKHALVFPSTGNFGIGGAWIGPRMGYRSLAVLPEDLSRERYEMIKEYGAQIVTTRASELSVKEVFEKAKELATNPENAVIEQYSEFGNYRFHASVTARAVEEVAETLARQGIGGGKPTCFVSAMGSAGTIGAGDPLKEKYGTTIVGLEPIQSSTLYNAGFGTHRIEGVGDKHVTWIHNVFNMDALMCIDDADTIRGLALIQEGTEHLIRELGVREEAATRIVGAFGMSGVCNVIGAIKAVKHFGLGADDLVVTVATDGFDRYPSVLEQLARREGRQTRDLALRRIEIFHRATTDWILEGRRARERWHHQKYYTWVEQHGKSIEALQRQKSQEFWREQRARAADIDKRILEMRG